MRFVKANWEMKDERNIDGETLQSYALTPMGNYPLPLEERSRRAAEIAAKMFNFLSLSFAVSRAAAAVNRHASNPHYTFLIKRKMAATGTLILSRKSSKTTSVSAYTQWNY